jgi:hypothetical protein
MDILFDVEPFDKVEVNLKLLDTFFYIKEEILKSLLPIKEKIILSEGSIVVVFTPNKIGIRFNNMDIKLSNEINNVLNINMDLSKIADKILSVNSN